MTHHPDTRSSDPSPAPARRTTAAERYYHELRYKDAPETVRRLEDTAKILLGVFAGASGLYLAAYKLAFGAAPVSAVRWYIPFVLWAAAMIALLMVITPQKYEITASTESFKTAVIAARDRKYRRLLIGVGLFIAGLLAGVAAFM